MAGRGHDQVQMLTEDIKKLMDLEELYVESAIQNKVFKSWRSKREIFSLSSY